MSNKPKIAVVGNGGVGKTTAARLLGERLQVPVFSVDKVQFEPGWQRADLAKVAEWHADALSQDGWIIDGWGAWELIEARLEACNAILFIDFPLETHLEWAKQRSKLSADGIDTDGPEGCAYHQVDELMDETLRRVDKDLLPNLRLLISRYENTKTVAVIHDPIDWHSTIDELCRTLY